MTRMLRNGKPFPQTHRPHDPTLGMESQMISCTSCLFVQNERLGIIKDHKKLVKRTGKFFAKGNGLFWHFYVPVAERMVSMGRHMNGEELDAFKREPPFREIFRD